mgnify:FL=1
MTPLQLELTKLIGNGRTKFEPDGGWYDCVEVLDEASLSDFHRVVNDKHLQWKQLEDVIYIIPDEWASIMIMYNSSKDLLDQDEETLKQMVSLIKETSSNQ